MRKKMEATILGVGSDSEPKQLPPPPCTYKGPLQEGPQHYGNANLVGVSVMRGAGLIGRRHLKTTTILSPNI